jgi:hypothetical protein
MQDINTEKLELIKLVCMLIILTELQKRTITAGYDKLSFKNILN